MNVLFAILLVVVALLPETALTPTVTARLAVAPGSPTATLAPNYAPVAIPVMIAATAPAPPALSATSWYAVDATTGQPLSQNHADTQRPIASVTKLVTALVIAREHPQNQVVTVPALPVYQPDDEIIGLQAGEKLTIHDLLSALLINSADDAADALALSDSPTEAAFVTKMNRTMVEWGVPNAHFSNPSGLVDANNGASAKALVAIAGLALRSPTIKQLVTTPSATIQDQAGRAFTLKTTDALLQSGQFQGIKTGYTAAAGQCFVGLTTIQGHRVITVVLDSQDRFGDTLTLADWINHTYQWQPPR